MIKILKRFFKNQESLLLSVQEQIWGQKFHDSIRGFKELRELSLFVGNWAGNYTFFYLLSRILQEYKFERIAELGLGESTKFISTFIESDPESKQTKHTIFEQNKDFANHFSSKFNLSNRSQINVLNLIETDVFGHKNQLFDFSTTNLQEYDLYVVDGPIGSANFSRFDLVKVLAQKKSGDEFLVLFDDVQRKGELDTLHYLVDQLKERKIEVNYNIYAGEKSVSVIATPKYKWALSF